MIKRDMKSVASVSATQNVLDGLSPAERKRFNKDYPGVLQEFKKIRSNIFARNLPQNLPKSKPKNPAAPKPKPKPNYKSPVAKPRRKQNSGVKFDTTGTLPGKTIKKN